MIVNCSVIGKRASFTLDGSQTVHAIVEMVPDPQTKVDAHVLTARVPDEMLKQFDSDDFSIAYKKAIADTGIEVRIIFASPPANRIPSDEKRALQAYQGTSACMDC
jgi:hypothetical protein